MPLSSLKKDTFIIVIILAGLPIVNSPHGIHCICLSHNLYGKTLKHATTNCKVLIQVDIVKHRELLKKKIIVAESHATFNMCQMLSPRHFLPKEIWRQKIFTFPFKVRQYLLIFFVVHDMLLWMGFYDDVLCLVHVMIKCDVTVSFIKSTGRNKYSYGLNLFSNLVNICLLAYPSFSNTKDQLMLHRALKKIFGKKSCSNSKLNVFVLWPSLNEW